MPRRKEELVNGEIYHVILRAIDDNLIFKNIDDYYRGVFSIYEFNNANPVTIQKRREAIARYKNLKKKMGRDPRSTEFGRPRVSTTLDAGEFDDGREKFVEVLAFCFMPNHIHLLLRQIKDGGVSKFMQKVGGGYGRYFNDKYKRKGHMFQDAFRSVHIEDDNQFMVVVPYIFTNPIALIEPGWKELGIRSHSAKEVVKFLENYKWSSYQDCIGVKNFNSVTQRDFLLEAMGGEEGLKAAVKNWIGHKKDIGQSVNLFLE